MEATWSAVGGSLTALAIVALVAAVAQVFAMCFVCCLYSSIGRRQGYMEYA